MREDIMLMGYVSEARFHFTVQQRSDTSTPLSKWSAGAQSKTSQNNKRITFLQNPSVTAPTVASKAIWAQSLRHWGIDVQVLQQDRPAKT